MQQHWLFVVCMFCFLFWQKFKGGRMSRTNKNQKGPGFEFWKSRLSHHGDTPCNDIKRITNRQERRVAKQQLAQGDDQIHGRENSMNIKTK